MRPREPSTLENVPAPLNNCHIQFQHFFSESYVELAPVVIHLITLNAMKLCKIVVE